MGLILTAAVAALIITAIVMGTNGKKYSWGDWALALIGTTGLVAFMALVISAFMAPAFVPDDGVTRNFDRVVVSSDVLVEPSDGEPFFIDQRVDVRTDCEPGTFTQRENDPNFWAVGTEIYWTVCLDGEV